MKLSANTRYAIRILLEIKDLTAPVSTAFLAEKTGISLRTVENIHAVLRQHKITGATVGPKGGIELLLPLAEVSLGQLIALFDEGVTFAVCCGDKSNDCPNQSDCGLRSVWHTVSQHVQHELDSISMDSILNQYKRPARDHSFKEIHLTKK